MIYAIQLSHTVRYLLDGISELDPFVKVADVDDS